MNESVMLLWHFFHLVADCIFQMQLQQFLSDRMLFQELDAPQARGEVNSLPLESGQTSDLIVTNNAAEVMLHNFWSLVVKGNSVFILFTEILAHEAFSGHVNSPTALVLPRYFKIQSSPCKRPQEEALRLCEERKMPSPLSALCCVSSSLLIATAWETLSQNHPGKPFPTPVLQRLWEIIKAV